MRESKFTSYDDLPLMLSAPEVAEVLGISRAGAYELVSSSGFPHMKIGNRILVPKDRRSDRGGSPKNKELLPHRDHLTASDRSSETAERENR